MGCDDQKNRCRGGCDLHQSGSCELRLRRSIPILRLVGLSSGLFLGFLVSLDDGTHGLGEVISPALHQDLVLFEESGCPECLLDRVCRVIRQGYFGDGSRDCCSFICPIPEGVPDPVWHRRYLKLFEEEWEPVSCNVIGPTHRREDSVLGGVGLGPGVVEQLLGLGGEGNPVCNPVLHPCGWDRPGGGVHVYLVPGGHPGLFAADAGESQEGDARLYSPPGVGVSDLGECGA